MNESLQSEKVPKDEYGWSNEELQMPLLYQAQYFDFFPENETAKRSIKSGARWNGHTKQVIVRAVDGFVYQINDVAKQPSLEEVQNIYEAAATAWRTWYLEQISKSENIPDDKVKRH